MSRCVVGKMACRVIERASSACGEVARAAAGTIGYSINVTSSESEVTLRAVQDTPADLGRTLFGRSDLMKRSPKRRRVCQENPPQAFTEGSRWVRNSTPSPRLQWQIVSATKMFAASRELPRLIQRVLQTLHRLAGG